MGPAQLRAAMGCGHGESPWEGIHTASGAALGSFSVMEWAVIGIHPAELRAGQAACTASQGRWMLGWAALRGISQAAASQALLGSCSCG